MADIGVQVDGLSRLIRDLERLGVEVSDLKEAMGRVATEVMPDYQRHVPRVTGALVGDFRAAKAKGRARLLVGRARVPYAGPVNYGWSARNIKPANFVAKGDAAAAPKASNSLEREISQLISQLNLD